MHLVGRSPESLASPPDMVGVNRSRWAVRQPAFQLADPQVYQLYAACVISLRRFLGEL